MKKDYKPIIFVLFAFLGINLFSFELNFVLRQALSYILLAFLSLSVITTYLDLQAVRWLRKHRSVVIFAISIVISLALFGRDLQAKWGVIDDHEIMSYLGERGNLPLQDIPAQLMQTEVGKPGQSLRYRPTYYVLRLLETSVWGKDATLWYATRLVILILSLSLAWMLLQKRLGFYISGVFLVYLLSFSYWKDIFARLGPGETYAVLGLTIFCWCFARIYGALFHSSPKTSPVSRWTWLGLFSSAILCVGSKENFLILLLPLLFLFYQLLRQKQLKLWLLCFFVITFAFFGLVGTSVVIATHKVGQDVYANSVVPASRAKVLIMGLKTHQSKTMVGISMVLFIFLCYLWWQRRNSVLFSRGKKIFISFGLLFGLYLSQYVFYNGDWPNGSRYDFPGMLVPPVFFLLLFLFLEQVVKEIGVPKVIQQGLKSGVLVGFCFLVAMKGFVPIEVAVKDNVQHTQAFTTRVERVSSILKQHPQAMVVIESGSVWDYEPVVSYERFLRAYEVHNPMAFRIHGYSAETAGSPLEKKLAAALLIQSVQGGGGYQPLSALSQYQKNCYSLDLSGQFATECVTLP